MRKILIVGGGQSGLQLALSLLSHDYDVTVMTVHTPDELFDGRAVSVQSLYDDARTCERAYGLNLWDDRVPHLSDFRASSSGEMPPFDWVGHLEAPAQSIDDRVKMSAWLDLFEHRGGKVIIHAATGSDLDSLARMYDLTIIAAGQHGLANMFDVDTSRELARMPKTATVLAYIKDSENYPDPHGIGVDVVPGLGHMLSWPAYSVNGRCRLVFLTGPLTEALSRWPRRPLPPERHLSLMLELMQEYLPHRYEVYRHAELADDDAVNVSYTNPLVRHPVCHLPSGGKLLGIGDSLAVTSPAVQQDANNAGKAAEIYLNAILEQGDRPFDEEFMHRTFDRYMDYAQHFTGEIAARLHLVPPYVVDMSVAGNTSQRIADLFANGFNKPAEFATWFPDEEATRALIKEELGE